MKDGRAFVGMITPSSNTVIERVACAILADLPEASCHFARIPFVGARIHEAETYDWDAMLTAARLLADAELDAIVWNGSKAGGIAFDLDRDLAGRLQSATGIAASTSVLAVEEVLRATGVRRLGLVSPFTTSYQQKVITVFAREGFEVSAELHLGLADNYSFSTVPQDTIRGMLRDVAVARPDALLAFCTNFRAAPLAAEMEQALGLPVYDSVSIGIWKALRLTGMDTRPAAARWGSVFAR